jgi:hypothetical protein
MGSKSPPASYSEKTLTSVEDVFHVADNAGLRVAVIHRLLELVDEGVRDSDNSEFFNTQPENAR